MWNRQINKIRSILTTGSTIARLKPTKTKQQNNYNNYNNTKIKDWKRWQVVIWLEPNLWVIVKFGCVLSHSCWFSYSNSTSSFWCQLNVHRLCFTQQEWLQRVGKKPRDNLFGAEHQSCILKATVELIIYKSWGCLVN